MAALLSSRAALARTSCWLLLSEEVRIAGELRLDQEALHFLPDPDHAEHALKVPLRIVLAAVVTPVKQRLLVQTAEETRWFDGPNIAVLGQRLEARLQISPKPEEDFDQDEPLWVVGRARWGWISGQLQLTDRRMRFVASMIGRWTAQALGLPARWDVRLEEIDRSPQQGAVVHAGTRGAQLRGPAAIAARLYLDEPALILAWPAKLRWSPVYVALTAARLLVVPVQGGPRLETPLEQLQRLQIQGTTLQIDSSGWPRKIGLSLPGAGLLFRRILRAAVVRAAFRSDAQGVRTLQTTAIWWTGTDGAELGVLRLDAECVHFQPALPQTPPVSIAVSTVNRQDAPAHRIRIENEGKTFLFEPAGGDKFVEQFWQRSLPPERTQPWPSSPEDRSRLLKNIRSVWLSDRNGFELMLHPGLLLDHEEGFGIVLPETVQAPPLGTEITIEVGRPDGIYQLDARLLAIAPLPAEIRIPRTGKVFVLNAPPHIRFYNQRSAFRIPLRMPVNAWRLRLDPRRNTWVPDGDRLVGHLIDLSISGCQLHTTTAIENGEHLFLELLIEDHWLPLEAECVRVTPGWPEGRQLGLRFLNLPDRLEQMLSRTILHQQRSELS